MIDSDTRASIGAGARINQAADNATADAAQSVNVSARNTLDAFAFPGGVGPGSRGSAAA